jgi:uncharacterized protein (TIGR00290 family)
MHIICFWSGGKDAAFMLHELRASDEHEVVALATTYDETNDRVAFGSLSLDGVRVQANQTGLPLVEIPLPGSAPDNDVYVERTLDALRTEIGDAADAVAYGDLHLSDVRAWRKQMFQDTPYRPLFPLWGRSTRKLARRIIRDDFQAVVTTIDTRVLPLEFLGRPFDEDLLTDLPDEVDGCGENGEFHTVVWGGPVFEQPLQGILGDIVAHGPFVSFQTELQPPTQR